MPDEEMHMSERRGNSWWINNVSTVLPILAQTIALVFYIVKMDTRISVLEERRIEDKASFTVITQLKEKAILTEAQVQTLTKSVERMELKLDQQRALEETKRRK